MAKSGNQKAKILYLERMLWQTGENNFLTMQEILDTLEKYGIHGERKSVYDDMEVLRSFGMDIQYKRGVGGGYYLAAQKDEVPEKLLTKGLPEQKASEDAVFEAPENAAKTAESEITETVRSSEPDAFTEIGKIPESGTETATEAVGNPCIHEPAVRPEYNEASGRKLKLLVDREVLPEIAAAVGDEVSWKEKNENTATVVLHVSEDEKFFGWLASFGKKVHIMKPAKTALAYRNFLKGIAREYKGIDK